MGRLEAKGKVGIESTRPTRTEGVSNKLLEVLLETNYIRIVRALEIL